MAVSAVVTMAIAVALVVTKVVAVAVVDAVAVLWQWPRLWCPW